MLWPSSAYPGRGVQLHLPPGPGASPPHHLGTGQQAALGRWPQARCGEGQGSLGPSAGPGHLCPEAVCPAMGGVQVLLTGPLGLPAQACCLDVLHGFVGGPRCPRLPRVETSPEASRWGVGRAGRAGRWSMACSCHRLGSFLCGCLEARRVPGPGRLAVDGASASARFPSTCTRSGLRVQCVAQWVAPAGHRMAVPLSGHPPGPSPHCCRPHTAVAGRCRLRSLRCLLMRK